MVAVVGRADGLRLRQDEPERQHKGRLGEGAHDEGRAEAPRAVNEVVQHAADHRPDHAADGADCAHGSHHRAERLLERARDENDARRLRQRAGQPVEKVARRKEPLQRTHGRRELGRKAKERRRRRGAEQADGDRAPSAHVPDDWRRHQARERHAERVGREDEPVEGGADAPPIRERREEGGEEGGDAVPREEHEEAAEQQWDPSDAAAAAAAEQRLLVAGRVVRHMCAGHNSAQVRGERRRTQLVPTQKTQRAGQGEHQKCPQMARSMQTNHGNHTRMPFIKITPTRRRYITRARLPLWEGASPSFEAAACLALCKARGAERTARQHQALERPAAGGAAAGGSVFPMRWHANGSASSTFASVSSANCKLWGGMCVSISPSSYCTLKVPSDWLTDCMRPRHHVPHDCQLARTRSPRK